MSSTEYAVLI